jgi:hypothetical protein
MSPPPPDVRRTRSGQAINRSIQQLKPSPSQTYRAPKSPTPKPKPKKAKKEKVKAEHRVARLDKPLSELTKTWTHVPVVDIDAYVNRSAEKRRQEVEEGKNPGKVKRPMNSFMLYRKAYQNRTKNWCLQNNHQVVSQVCGDSWPLEPDAVREQFNEWARIERQNHQNAHPGYKFSPAKAGTAKAAKRKASMSGEESDLEDFDWEGSGRSSKRQRLTPKLSHTPPVPFNSQPYYGFDLELRGSSLEPGMGGGYPSSTYQASNPGMDPPEPYRSDIPERRYWHQEVVRNPQNPHVQDVIFRRTISPGMNPASHPGYHHVYYPHNGGMNGSMGEYPVNGYHGGPDVKIDPSLMGLAQPYSNPYAIGGSETLLDDNGLMFNQHHLQQPLEDVDRDLKEEYPEYLGTQTGVADAHIPNQQVVDPNNLNNWQIVDSLDTGDEFNNKWMDGESGQDA